MTCPAGSAAADWLTEDPPPEGPARGGEMNGFSTEEDSREGPPAAPAAAPGYGQSCCLIEDGERCVRPAGNASFSKRVQKSISQKKLKLDIDKSVSPPAPGWAPAPGCSSPRSRDCGRDSRALPALGLAAFYLLRSWTRDFQGRFSADILSLRFCPNPGGWGRGASRTLPAWEDGQQFFALFIDLGVGAGRGVVNCVDPRRSKYWGRGGEGTRLFNFSSLLEPCYSFRRGKVAFTSLSAAASASAQGHRALCFAGRCEEMGFQGYGRKKAKTRSFEVVLAVQVTGRKNVNFLRGNFFRNAQKEGVLNLNRLALCLVTNYRKTFPL